MKFKHLKYLIIIFFLVKGATLYSQNSSDSEKQIVNLRISFQQNRFTNKDKAKDDIEKAIGIAELLNDKSSLLTCKILLGEFYDDNNNFKKAYQQYTESVDLAVKLNDYSGLAKVKYNLGFLFYKESSKTNQNRALVYFEESIKLAETTNDELLKAKALNLMAVIYYDINKLDDAEITAKKALLIFNQINKKDKIPQCYIILARINNKQEDYKTAIDYITNAIDLYSKSNNFKEINNALLVKSEVYLKQKDYPKALKIAEEINTNPTVLTDQKIYALQLLYEINKSMNNHKKSLDYLEENKFISDSIFKLERGKMEESVRAEIEAKNQLKTLEKENEINGLKIKQSNYLIMSLVAVLVLLLMVAIIMYLVFRQNKLKAEREKIRLEQQSIQMEQKLLRTQMNPHFIANALAAIQGNIYTQDKEKSVTYLSKFAKLMRFILESSRQKEILLSNEILSLKNYLDLQKLLLEEKLSYTINVAKGTNTDELLIPPMLIQPYVENAIKHGIELKKGNGNVTVNFSLKDNDILQVEVIDDGLGVEEVSKIYANRKSTHLSYSTNITQERINNLGVQNQSSIKITTENVLIQNKICGTKVELLLPIKKMFD